MKGLASNHDRKKGKRKVRRVPQSQTAAPPRHQEEGKTDKNPNKHKSNKHTKSTKTSYLVPKRDNRNAKMTEKHKNKMTQKKETCKFCVKRQATKTLSERCLKVEIMWPR